MNKQFYLFTLLLVAGVIFTGCRSNDETLDIVVSNPGSLMQIVPADKTGASSVQITTRAPWRSSISEATTQSTRNSSPWVSITPENGGVGSYEIKITLVPNTTGTERTAIITITSGDEDIIIRITQKYVTEEGISLVPATPTTDPGVIINGVRWATRNVGAFGTFADSPEDAGMFYQWNRPTAWSATGDVSGWDSTLPIGTIWERENDPCPPGWRVPTNTEIRALSLMSAWGHSSWTSQNDVNGTVVGIAPHQIFLPAVGHRNAHGIHSTNHPETGIQHMYWGRQRAADTEIYAFSLHPNRHLFGRPQTYRTQAFGFSVRCVEDITVLATAITLDRTTMTLPVTGVAPALRATITPAGATDTRVIWASSNEAVATVSHGAITAVAIGNATITAATACGVHTETVAVTVTTLPDISSSLDGVVINGIRWATRNVDMPGTFVETPESLGMFYQWNRNIGWSSTNPMIDSNGGITWNSSIPTGTTWYAENDPCPAGWRVPTQQELESLNRAGSVWITYNNIAGHLYGTAPNHIFLPSTGRRFGNNGSLLAPGEFGFYWSSTQIQDLYAYAWGLSFASAGSASGLNVSGSSNVQIEFRTTGAIVRCVAE